MGGMNIEVETFEWFVNNDKPDSSIVGERQCLRGFTKDTKELPALQRPNRASKKMTADQEMA